MEIDRKYLKRQKFAGWEWRFTPLKTRSHSYLNYQVIVEWLRFLSGGKPPFPTCEFAHAAWSPANRILSQLLLLVVSAGHDVYICEHSNDFPGRPRMLSLLNISNIALIDELRVEFGRGLNLLTARPALESQSLYMRWVS